MGICTAALVSISRPQPGGAASSPARSLVVCALIAFLGLALATEARAADESADVVTEETVSSATEGESSTSGPDEATSVPDEGETPAAGSGDPSAEGTPPVSEDPVAPVEATPPEAPAPQLPPADPAPSPSTPPSDGPPGGEVPAPEPPPAASPPVVVSPPVVEPPVVEPPPLGEPIVEAPADPVAPPPAETPPTAGPHRGSIVIRNDFSPQPALPPLLSSSTSSVDGELESVTWTGDRLQRQSGPRPETRNKGPAAAVSVDGAPLPPPIPARERAPTGLYVSVGGQGGASSGGFFVGMLAAAIALALAGQRLGSLVSLSLAPPRRTAFALRLDRPD